MAGIRTTVQNRRIEVPAPEDLPDGTEVVVELVPIREEAGLSESGWDDTPEGIAAWLHEYESLEPLIFTSEELEILEADRQERKACEKGQYDSHAERLAKQWE